MRKLLWFSCGFAAAALLFVYGTIAVFAALTAAAATALFFLRANEAFRRRALAVLLGAALAFGWCAAYRALFVPKLDDLPKGQTEFTAVVTEPLRRSGSRYLAEAEIRWHGRPAPGILFFPGDVPEILPGDTVRGVARLRAAKGWSEYLPARGGFLTGSVRELRDVTRQTAPSVRFFPAYAAHALRQSVRDCFPAEGRGFFLALVTGDRSELSFARRNSLSICGLYHTISLSGMHVAVLAGFLCALCGRRRALTALLGLPAVWLFTLLSGAAPGTVRAAVMQTVLLMAPLLRREYDPPTALAAALLLILTENPWAIAGIGTQMSFLATAGILLLSGPLTQRLTPERWKRGRIFAPLRGIVSTAAVSLSAIAVTQPFSAAYFGTASLAALPVNLLCVWAVTLAFAGGILTAVFGLIAPSAAAVAAGCLDLLRRWIDLVTDFFARFPMTAVYDGTPYLLVWVCFFGALIPAVILLRPKLRTTVLCTALTLALCLGFTLAERSDGFFSVLDVGQGQSVLWHDGDCTAVIDCGGAGEESGEIAARALLSEGVRRVDALILTHFDRDHVEGVAQLAARLPIGRLYMTEDPKGETILALAEEKGIPVTVVTERLPIREDALCLLPPTPGKTGNAGCLSVLASADGCDILVTGDLNEREEKALLARETIPDLEVLVAGHHGSADATGAALLHTLHPELVLISVGENAYGHPAPEMLARVCAAGGKAATTPDNGTMTIRW